LKTFVSKVEKFQGSVQTELTKAQALFTRGKTRARLQETRVLGKQEKITDTKQVLEKFQNLERRIKREIVEANKSLSFKVKISKQLPKTLDRIEKRLEKTEFRLTSQQKKLAGAEKSAEAQAKQLGQRRTLDAANKISEFIEDLREVATNEPGLATRAITTGAAFGDARNAALRGFATSFFMFKSFPISVIMNHLAPAIRSLRQGDPRHLAAVIVGTTSLGAAVIQTKQMLSGKTPRDFDDPKFWMAAMLQGGGAGLFGDFMFADYSRFGRSPITELTGPLGGLLDDIGRATKGNMDRFIDGKDPNFLRDIFRVAKRNTPGVNLWYSRLIVERLLFDQLEMMIDPKFNKRRRQFERRIKKQTGQEFWWKKGEISPRQSPLGR